MKKHGAFGFADVGSMLLATVTYRVAAVVLVLLTLPLRTTLPAWMIEWFGRISYPLLLYNLLPLVFYKKAAALLSRRPWLLYADLLVSIGVIQIGGSWRSSYFVYTITTIIFFTIFRGKRGAYVSALALTAAATIKDPSGGMSSMRVFFVSDWDMRLGAGLVYVTAGVILGYFRDLLENLEDVTKAKVEESRKRAAMEEQTRMALELHDGAKQMINAVLLKMNLVVRTFRDSREETADEIRWLWRAMHFLKVEMNQVMSALTQGEDAAGKEKECRLLVLIEDEARIAEVMTGFSWRITADTRDTSVPLRSQTALRRFLGEAFMNAWKHSGVDAGTVSVRFSETRTVISIADAGRGFHGSGGEDAPAMGLKSLKHRARELNGELSIRSAPGSGCTVVLALPPESGKSPSQK